MRAYVRFTTGVLLMLAACCQAGAAEAVDNTAPAPGPPPPPAFTQRATPLHRMSTPTFRTLQVGPKDSTLARKMRGKMTIMAVAPADAGVKSIEVTLDGRSVGKAAAAPFSVEVDSTTVTDGAHTIKAIGHDAAGKEVWSASSQVEVVNTRDTAGEHRTPGSVAGPTPGVPPQMSQGSAKPGTPASPRKAAQKPAAALPSGITLDRTYSSDDYGFSISYPGTWTFKDKTAVMKPKSPGGFWLTFGSYPIEKSTLVVNVRRLQLEPGTDAAKFATYNSYVKKWESRTTLGYPAFATSGQATGKDKGMVHRMIVIKDGCAWMLNCVDQTGKPSAESRGLLEAMVNSISTASTKR